MTNETRPGYVPEACRGCEKLKLSRQPNGARLWRCSRENRTVDPFGENRWACAETPTDDRGRKRRYNEAP